MHWSVCNATVLIMTEGGENKVEKPSKLDIMIAKMMNKVFRKRLLLHALRTGEVPKFRRISRHDRRAMMSRAKHKRSFTLVELSIVLSILGILISGLLAGKKLIANSEVAATIKQIEIYRKAINTFYQTYGYLPGDFPNAQYQLAPKGYETKTPAELVSLISSNRAQADKIPINGEGRGKVFQCIRKLNNTANYYSEAFGVWSHLGAAGLIDKQYSNLCKTINSGITYQCVEPGYNMPEYEYGSGNGVYYFTNLMHGITNGGATPRWGLIADSLRTDIDANKHHALVLASFNDYTATGAQGGVSEELCGPLTYVFAYLLPLKGVVPVETMNAIDAKIDDGFPLTGHVFGVNEASSYTWNINSQPRCANTNEVAMYSALTSTQLQDANFKKLNVYRAHDTSANCIGVFSFSEF